MTGFRLFRSDPGFKTMVEISNQNLNKMETFQFMAPLLRSRKKEKRKRP